jgi:hypothetical protein
MPERIQKMNPKLAQILLAVAGRNALQLAVGFAAGLWWASSNLEAVGQIQTLLTAIGPALVSIGGIAGLAMSLGNSIGLWKAEPPSP